MKLRGNDKNAPGEENYGDDLSAGSCTSAVGDALSKTIAHWKVLLFGQALSILFSTAGAVSTEYKLKCNLNTPLLLLALMYLLLSVHFFSNIFQYLKTSKVKRDTETDVDQKKQPQFRFPLTNIPLKGPWRLYFLVALLNVESNYFLVRAFHYTSITSISLLTSLSIPGAMIASRFLLKSKYSVSHYVGATICMFGVALSIFSDLKDDSEKGDDKYPNKAMGDFLAAVGGLLYGVSDALVETCVKKYYQWEYLGIMGFFGFTLSTFQMYLLEMPNVIELFDGSAQCEPNYSAILIVSFIVINYMKNVGDSYFLLYSEAALLNMSLLTSDFYSALFSIYAEGIIPSYISFIALLFIVIGVIAFENGPPSGTLDDQIFESTLVEGTKDFEVTGLTVIGSIA